MNLMTYNPADRPEYKQRRINLDITHRCVLQCSKCMRYFKPGLWKRGKDISVEDYDKICKYFPGVLMCGQMGDPIYHPKFHSLMEVTLQRNAALTVSTNGHGKKDSWWDRSFDLSQQLKYCEWIFGVDGLPKDSHNYRVGQDGEAVWQQMIKGAALGVNITWQYIVFAYNENDIEEAQQMANDHNIKLMVTESSRWVEDDPLRPTKHYIPRVLNKEIEMWGKTND